MFINARRENDLDCVVWLLASWPSYGMLVLLHDCLGLDVVWVRISGVVPSHT